MDEGLLLEKIESFPCIWNTKDKNHKNLLMIQNAWKSIAHIMEANVEDCKEIWKSLRNKYIRERKLVQKMPSGSAAYTGHWPLFKNMSFLASTIQTRRTIGNIKKLSQQSTSKPSEVWSTILVDSDAASLHESQELLDQEDESNFGFMEFSEVEMEDQRETYISSDSSTPMLQETPTTSRPTNTKGKQIPKRKEQVTPTVNNLVDTCTSIGESLTQFIQQSAREAEKKDINNEDYYFALSIAESLSKIKDQKKKLVLKSQFLLMIADALQE